MAFKVLGFGFGGFMVRRFGVRVGLNVVCVTCFKAGVLTAGNVSDWGRVLGLGVRVASLLAPLPLCLAA